MLRALLRPRARLVAILLAAALAAPSAADVFVLKDGRRIEGTLVKEEQGTLTVRTGVGELKLARADVVEIVARKTPTQEFEARFQAAKTAEEFFQAGEFAREKKLKREAQKAWKRAVELDTNHVGARTALGFVLYQGEWLVPEERDRRIAAAEEAAMTARGLVRWQDRWVTPEDKARLEQGLVQEGGVWIPFAEAQRRRGLEEFEGAWLPRAVALARRDLSAVAPLAKVPMQFAIGADVLVAGPFPEPKLTALVGRLGAVRTWFDARWRAQPGLEIFGGRLAELYVFGSDSKPYEDTVPHFASLTRTVPPGWAEAVARSHGFFWVDPYPLSSARQWHRDEVEVDGHCLHHFGHLLCARLGYDGRLLPAWYEEAIASHAELAGHGRNAVFCRGFLLHSSGSSAGGAAVSFDPARMRDGGWREYLKAAFAQKAVPAFDRLAQLEFATLELPDVATAMAIVAWLETRKEGAGLRAFHDALRHNAPASPLRVIEDGAARRAAYDRAFRAAAGLDTLAADQAWRQWFLAGG